MKRILLLIAFCAFAATAFAQLHENLTLFKDSMQMTLPQLATLQTPDTVFHLRPMNFRSGADFRNYAAQIPPHNPMIRPRIIIIRPPKIIVHQKCVMYGSQVVFLQPPQVIIIPAQVAYK